MPNASCGCDAYVMHSSASPVVSVLPWQAQPGEHDADPPRTAQGISDRSERLPYAGRKQMAAQAHDDAPALRGVAFQEPVVSRPDAAFRNGKGRGPIRC